MKILFDHCTPRPLRRYLTGHEVKTAYQMGWDRIVNGRLLALAEAEFDVFLTVDRNIPEYQMGWDRIVNGRLLALAEAEFDVFLTVDRNIPDQQNMRGRTIAVIVMGGFDTSPVTLAPLMPQVLALLPMVEPGQVYIITAQDKEALLTEPDC